MRKGTITEGGKKIKWEQTATGIKYSDGRLATPGAGNMDAKLAYKTAKIPVVEPPINVIIPPSPGTAREIGNKEFAVLQDVENENFILTGGGYTKSAYIRNLSNVRIDGLGKVQFQTKSRCIQLEGNISKLSIGGCYSKDIQDYQIATEGMGDKAFNSGAGQFIDGLEIFNWHSENGGCLFHANGEIKNGEHYGVIKDFQMHGCSFTNSPKPGMVCYLGSAMGYNVHGNIVDNINTQNDDHNGIFMLKGNGRYWGNKVTNHQGNALRAWLFSHIGEQSVEIFNNIVFNSSHYGAFEIQTTPHIRENWFKKANARVYNNTAGQLNTNRVWQGQMLDVYFTGGNLEYVNNLGFDMRGTRVVTDMINYAGDSPNITLNSNNRYFEKWEQAVRDLTIFKSLHPGVGAQ